MSTINNLHDVYIENLKDMYSANDQSHKVTLELHEAATHPELKKALKAGAEGIEKGQKAITSVLAARDETPGGKHCKGMEGLVKEARAHGIKAEFGDPDAQDAMIIAQYQRMVHYAIAGYGCAEAWAERLGYSECAEHLEKCLEDTRSGDTHMTDIATGKHGINAAAA